MEISMPEAFGINLTTIAAMAAVFLIGYLMGRGHHHKDPSRIGTRRRRHIRADNTVERARRYERDGSGYDAETVAQGLPGAARHHLERREHAEALDAVRAAFPAISAGTARRALRLYAQANGL